MILRLGAEGHDRVGVYLASGVSDVAHAGAGEDFEAEIAASLGPFIGLLGEDATGEADDRVPGGEDADTVGSAADLSVQPLVGLFDQICCHRSLGNEVNARMSARVASRFEATAGSFSLT